MWIEPRGFEEIRSRQHRGPPPPGSSKWVPFGVGAIEGKANKALPVLESGQPPEAAEMTERAATDTNAGIVESTDLLTPEQLAANGEGAEASNGHVYGPGEEPRPREGEPTALSHGELL